VPEVPPEVPDELVVLPDEVDVLDVDPDDVLDDVPPDDVLVDELVPPDDVDVDDVLVPAGSGIGVAEEPPHATTKTSNAAVVVPTAR
jgi:hypothetical protein